MTKPEALGFSAARLARLDAALDERYVASGKLPCIQAQIWRRGALAHQTMLGRMDLERDKRLREDTIFRIYSMTKPITSVAFMMLAEEGLVSLDEPVHRRIPAWRDLGVYQSGVAGAFVTRRPDAPMRMIDLLRHTSGLTYGFQMRTNVDAAYRKEKLDDMTREGGLDGLIEALSHMPLEFSPGTAWNYSVSTDVLGYLVQNISGVPFDVFLHERIFKPLGMRDTGFFADPQEAHRLAACYALTPSGRTILQDDPATSRYLAQPSVLSGGGGLVSTAHDYMRFARMLLNRGSLDGVQILSPKTVALMTLNHIPGGRDLTEASVSLFSEATYAGLGFGLGVACTRDVAKTMLPDSVGSYFWGGMASTFFWVDPLEDLAVVFMTQLMPSTSYPVRRDLRTLVYAAMTESAAA
ncbi:MAG: serine hydrolase domain-containing protein [Hyphomonadaceae bacterium]|nr:serine hydrolase domain-containing protein [Hyphomonadaceae bacterium]